MQVREAVRRVDWRFLLDDPQIGTFLPLNCADDELLVEGVRHVGAAVVDRGVGALSGPEVVFVRDPDRDDIDAALALVRPAGAIVMESTSRRSRREAGARLRRAGLRVRHFGCWPSCSTATRFVPLDDRAQLIASADAAKNRRRRAIGTLLARLGLGSLLFRQATTVATTAVQPQLAAPLRVAFGDDSNAGAAITLLTPRFGSSRHIIAMITDDRGRPLVVKTPRVAGDDDQLSLEAGGLASISGAGPLRPELVADTERFGHRWLVETCVAGVPLSRRHVERHPERWLAAARTWLDQMPSSGSSTPDEDGRSERLILPALEVISACAGREPDLRKLIDDAERAVARLRATDLPVVVEHGDFRPPNLIIAGRGSIGAVDWELAERSGFPLYDLLFFHDYVADVVPGLRPMLRRTGVVVLRAQGLDPDLLGPLSTLASLRQLANLVARGTGTVSSEAPAVADSDVARAWFALLDARLADDQAAATT